MCGQQPGDDAPGADDERPDRVDFAVIQRIYLAALDRPESARAAYLVQACGGDQALLDAVQRLLRNRTSDQATSPVERALGSPTEPTAEPTADILDGSLLQHVPVVDGAKWLDPCLLTHRLGSGGAGAVFAGRHQNLQIDVAVKCLLPGSVDDQAVLRFQREARIAASVSHSNLVRVFDVRHAHGLHYIVMEFVDGQSLQQLVEREGAMAPERAGPIVLAAALGLAAAHARGIVHRDVKPGNLMHSRDGETKVVDLGLAKAVQEAGTQLTGSRVVMGTLRYMPPEQYDGAATVLASGDVYALGATLAHLLTGCHPFAGLTPSQVMQAVVRDGFRASGLDVSGLPRKLRALIQRATALRPAERHQDAGAFAKDLAAVVARLPRARPAAVQPATGGQRTTATQRLRTTAPVPRDRSIGGRRWPLGGPASRGLLLLVVGLGLLGLRTCLAEPGPAGGPDEPSETIVAAAPSTWVPGRPAPVMDGLTMTRVNPFGLPVYALDLGDGVDLELVLLPAGSFLMGSADDEPLAFEDEQPRHRVQVPAFLMAVTECTQAQWEVVMHEQPAHHRAAGVDAPVEQVSWEQIQVFEERTGLALPSEAQWEYAARAGSSAEDDLDDVAWWSGDGAEGPRPVAGKAPNAFGLHDTLGNVWEWCEDTWHDSHEGAPDVATPRLSGPTDRRVVRGGGHTDDAWSCRPGRRRSWSAGDRFNDLGFRPCLRLE